MLRFALMVFIATQILLIAKEEAFAQKCISFNDPKPINTCRGACTGGYSLSAAGSCPNQYTCTCLN